MDVKIAASFIMMLLGIACPCSAFLPTKFLAWTVDTLDTSSDSVLTHKDMTKSAILEVAAEVLTRHPNPKNSGSSAKIAAIENLDEETLVTAYYGQQQSSRWRDFQSVIEEIADANSNVDLNKNSRINAAAHFDSEQFQAGQSRLVRKRQIIIAQIRASNFKLARLETGQALHTLQDFYSHSNWIENGNVVPHQSLGKENKVLTNTARGNTRTCTDCTVQGRSFTARLFYSISRVVNPQTCQNNIMDNLKRNNIITTGYQSGQVDENGQQIAKPYGKCSRGGFLDSTSKAPATGGINKDSPFQVWSPHYYLFDDAVRVAINATVDFLSEIRTAVENDTLFSTFLGVPLIEEVQSEETRTISIAYVIDTTGSMGEELPEIQATLTTIKTNLIAYVSTFGGGIQVRYILVPFNDPDPGLLFETGDIDEFIGMIAELHADGGGDVPEPSIGATIRAIEASEPGSPIYVFTDAVAKDSYRSNEATALLTVKRTPIYFSLVNLSLRRKRSLQEKHYTRENRKKRQTGDNVYEQLATFSGGQILHVQTNDISNLGNLVSFSVLQNRRTIFYASGTSHGTVSYVFPIDSSVLEATVSISGQNIIVSILAPQGVSATSLMEYSLSLNTRTSYISQFRVSSDSLRGNWSITIQSQGSYSIQVQGIGDLIISREMYQIDPSSIYGISSFSGKPLQGEPVFIIVTIESSNSTLIRVNKFNIIDNNGNITESLDSLSNLTSVSNGSYAAAFIPPSESFAIQLTGTDQSGYWFSHFFDTSVEISPIFLIPRDEDISVINLSPGDNETVNLLLINYGSSGEFQLSVTANNRSQHVYYDLSPNMMTLGQNSSVEIEMIIYAEENVSEDLAVTFTIIAQSTADSGISNFIEINVLITSIVYTPPTVLPETESDTTTSQAFVSTSESAAMVTTDSGISEETTRLRATVSTEDGTQETTVSGALIPRFMMETIYITLLVFYLSSSTFFFGDLS